MNSLSSFLSLYVQNPEVVRWALTAVVALLLFTLAMAVTFVVANYTAPTRRRLRQLQEVGVEPVSVSAGGERVNSSLHAVGRFFAKNDKEVSRIRLRLLQAGIRAPNAVFIYFAIKLLLAVGLPLLVFALAPLFHQATLKGTLYAGAIALALGMFGPNWVLNAKVHARQDQIRRGFPDALDLLVVCVEAGLGLDLALRRVAAELYTSHPVLAQELAIVNGEVGAGVDRLVALRNFANRTGLDDIRGFVALLSQSIRFGTTVAETLRVYAADFRDKRMQQAEEQAAKIGTKLIFPMIFCFFPAFFVVAVGPILLKVLRVLGPN